MSSKLKFFIFLIIFIVLICSAGYLAYNYFMLGEQEEEIGDVEKSTEDIVYVKPDIYITGDIVEIRDQSIIVLNRSSGKNEQYYFTEDSECFTIESENDKEDTCDYNSLSASMNIYMGLGSKLVIYADTSNIKKVNIFLSET